MSKDYPLNDAIHTAIDKLRDDVSSTELAHLLRGVARLVEAAQDVQHAGFDYQSALQGAAETVRADLKGYLGVTAEQVTGAAEYDAEAEHERDVERSIAAEERRIAEDPTVPF